MCSTRERIDGELVATRGGYGQKVSVEVDFPGRSTVLLAIRGNVFKAPEQAGIAANHGLRSRLPVQSRANGRENSSN